MREKLAFLPAKNDAVGRTSDITGEAESTGDGDALTFTTASFEIDLTTLTSDEDRRDQRIREIGIESDRFPTATFALAEPLELELRQGRRHGRPDAPRRHEAGDDPARGPPVRLDRRGRRMLTFPWGDFDMTAPSVAGFVNVEDEATMEFDLKLERG